MAFIKAFLAGNKTRVTTHPTQVVCSYTVVEVAGKRLMQLDTHGSSDREFPGKLSQTLQIDEQGAAELTAILKRSFSL